MVCDRSAARSHRSLLVLTQVNLVMRIMLPKTVWYELVPGKEKLKEGTIMISVRAQSLQDIIRSNLTTIIFTPENSVNIWLPIGCTSVSSFLTASSIEIGKKEIMWLPSWFISM